MCIAALRGMENTEHRRQADGGTQKELMVGWSHEVRPRNDHTRGIDAWGGEEPGGNAWAPEGKRQRERSLEEGVALAPAPLPLVVRSFEQERPDPSPHRSPSIAPAAVPDSNAVRRRTLRCDASDLFPAEGTPPPDALTPVCWSASRGASASTASSRSTPRRPPVHWGGGRTPAAASLHGDHLRTYVMTATSTTRMCAAKCTARSARRRGGPRLVHARLRDADAKIAELGDRRHADFAQGGMN